jgi:glutamate/tyrosine decarboxylase-like PLP-dependent enzyme
MPSRNSFQPALDAAVRYALDHLSPEQESPVAATATLTMLRDEIDVALNDEGLDAKVVIDELVRSVEGGIVNSAGPRFFGWVIGGALPSALAADWLTSTWDQNAALYPAGPAAAVVEETVGRWLKDLLQLPSEASFALVTGCQMAHATCLAAARNALLARRGWDVEQQGLAGAPAIRIVGSTELHSTVGRAVRLLGIGAGQIVPLAVGPDERLLAGALEAALAEKPDAPTIVILQAGDVNTGVFDDFEALIPIARKFGAWVHIDGAMGLWTAASAKLRHLVRGVAAADSWTTDGHKWLNVPYDCGFAFVADAEAHRRSFAGQAAYARSTAEVRNPLDWTPEFSRRARGFASYAALRELGRNGVAELVDRCCDLARALATRIGALEGAELVWEPRINQGLVGFLDPSANATTADHDRRTEAVIAGILASGEAMFTATTWRGRRLMRVSVSNWRTTEADVDRVVRCVARVLEGMG